jgi:hypothetical protein
MENEDIYDEMFKVYGTSFYTVNKMMDIFFQGDFRYLDLYRQIIVAGFIDNKAISIEQEIINPETIKKSNIKIKGPQKDIKQIAVGLLKENGFEIKGFEIWIRGGIVDILASKEKRQIAVECGPCRIDKSIDYLEIPNTDLWILTRKNENSEHILFKITRGKNWANFLEYHKKYQLEKKQKTDRKSFQKRIVSPLFLIMFKHMFKLLETGI